MTAKAKRPKPINLLIKLVDGPAEKLREISARESRSNVAQAKIILEKGLEEYGSEDR